MFYANLDPDKKNFQGDQKQQQDKKCQKPGSAKPPKVFEQAGNQAIDIDQRIQNIVLKDLEIGSKPNQYDAVEQLLNQHKIREQSPKPTDKKQLNQSITARLAQVEKLCHNQKLELKEKYSIIAELRDKMEEQKKYISYEKTQFIQELKKEKEENQKLRNKIQEMEEFLNKYGIKWAEKDQADRKMKQIVSDISQPKPLFNYHLPKEISIDIIQKRVQELNYIIEKEGANQIVKNAQGMHQFQRMDPILIGFYKNGIAMKGFKFFSYGSNDAYQILADILDGYFPYQLKKQYPNGILLKVLDKTEDIYESERENQVDVKSNEERQLKPQSKDEFLNQLPQHIIKNGKIIPVRSFIGNIFNENNQEKNTQIKGCRKDPLEGNWIVDTEAQKQLDQGQELQDVCTLKFRSETGKFTFICLMFSQQTIKQMYQTVTHLRENQDKQIEIILNFPRTIFNPEDETTLEDAGLCPSAQLFFKSV